MNQVFVCGTYFHVYVSMLKHIYREDRSSKSLIVLNDHTPGIEKIIPALKANGFFNEHLYVPFRKIEREVKKNNSWLHNFFNRNKVMVHAVEENSDINQYAQFIQNSEFNLFYLWGYPSAYFILRYPKNYARIIEDGARNYLLKISWLKYFKRKYLLSTYIGDGLDHAIKEIQLQYPEQLHYRLKHKGTILELRKMQADLLPADNLRILNVFMSGHEIHFDDHSKLLIITQPLSEDGFVTEQYKISLYKEMIDLYSQGRQVYLKPHPRELTDYKKYLPCNFIEIPRAFPLEMFDLMQNINFDTAVTLFSSSLSNITCITEKIELGKSYVKQFLPGKKLV